MSTLGPTVFVIKQAEVERPFKVYIGDNQRCSCGGGEGRGALCMHLMYVMIKVLRVPDNNPLSWQLSLVDSEVTNILAGRIGSSRRNGGAGRTHAFLRRGSGASSAEGGGGSSRQADDGAPKRERKEVRMDKSRTFLPCIRSSHRSSAPLLSLLVAQSSTH